MSAVQVETRNNNLGGCIKFCEQTMTDERLPVGRNMPMCRLTGKALQYRNTASGPVYDQLSTCPYNRAAEGCQSVFLREPSKTMHPLREIRVVNDKGAEKILVVR